MRYFLGIDPGASGAAVFLREDGIVSAVRPFKDWTRLDYANKLRNDIEDCRAVRLVRETGLFAAVEKVGPMPGQGVTSMFSFGQNYERVLMLLAVLMVSTRDVSPKQWQKEFGLSAKYDSQPARKRAHKAKAEQLFPRSKITIQTADAFLIAEWLRRQEVKQ